MLGRAPLASALIATSLAWASPALACGGLFCGGGGSLQTVVEQTGERILFAADGQEVTAYVQIQYQGEPKDFSWIVPVPTEPTVSVGLDVVFDALRAGTAPTYGVRVAPPGDECFGGGRPKGAGTTAAVPVGSGDTMLSPGGVTVLQRSVVGPYDTAVLRATDATTLKAWLTENKYVVPPALDPLLDPYIAGKYLFVALKLTKDRTVGDIQPVVMKYAATKPGIPIRLTGVAATPDMAVYVWVLGKSRAVPENFRHVKINEARLDWLGNARNYAALVTAAADEAGGQAFVTEFAGPTANVAPGIAPTIANADLGLEELRGTVDAGRFRQVVLRQGFFRNPQRLLDEAAALAFFQRHFKKPAAHAAVADAEYFLRPDVYPTTYDQEPSAGVTTALAELEMRFGKPTVEARALFERHPYLTRMYTTMSPQEMTQDPLFVFNPDLPPVTNIHMADAVMKCSGSRNVSNAPLELTLPDGQKLLVDRNADLGAGKPTQLPAAARVEQLKAEGGASVIVDNQARITSIIAAEGALAVDPGGAVLAVPRPPTGGFGCAGCGAVNAPRPPATQGLGELAGYALVVAGFFGWRRFRRRA